MIPKKPKVIAKQVSEELDIEQSLVEDLTDFFYKDVRTTLSSLEQLRIKLEIIPNIIVISETKIIDTHCCYPKVGYKAIQDNYKLGSQNTTVMRMAKFLINRHN